MATTELTSRGEALPDTIEKLNDYILIGKEKLKAYQAKVKAIEIAGFAKAVRDQALEEAQDMATALLAAEVRLGELLAKHASHVGSKTGQGGSEKTLPPGITYDQSSHAQKLAAHPEIVEAVIQRAKERGTIPRSGDVLREIAARKRAELRKETIPLPAGKYRVIYADPPWPVDSMVLDKWDSPIDDKYRTMTVDEIKALDVASLCADDCSLFLWTTHTYLHEALHVLEAWGFKYHCCITWDKGSGWSLCGFHRMTEFCLYGYKGNINVNQVGDFIPTLIREKKRNHSQKPDVMYELLESNTPEPRIELFARSTRPGWAVWGDQV